MKAERRHELQHNELADWVAQSIERVRPYSRAIMGVALLAAVCLLAYVVISKRSADKQAAAWDDYYRAIQAPSKEGVEADLQAVSRDHEGQPGGLWAEVALADIRLGEGVAALFSDKSRAEKKLKQAVEHYEEIVGSADDPLLLSRARFGLARALESLGQLKEARAAYEQIVDGDANAYVSLARSRLDDLDRESTQEFYAWFAQQEPVPISDSSLPGTPGEKLPFDDSIFGTPGDLNPGGGKILDIPPLGKETPGPLLNGGAKSSDDSAKKPDADGDRANDETKQADEAGSKEGDGGKALEDGAKNEGSSQSDAQPQPSSDEKKSD